MNKTSILLFVLFFSTGLFAQDDDLTINLKVGTNFSGLADENENVSTKNKFGYNGGIDLRIGAGLVFLQPGIFFYQYNQTYNVLATTAGAVRVERDIKVQTVKVPVLLGIRPVSGSDLAFRINAGAAFNFPVNVSGNDMGFAISKENYKTANVGAVVGAGLDLSMFTFDINYEFGLSDYIDFSESKNLNSESSKQYVVSLNVGVRF